MAVTTTTTLAGPVAAYYEKRFLMRSEENFIFEGLGSAGRIPKHEGKQVLLSVPEMVRTLLSFLWLRPRTLTI